METCGLPNFEDMTPEYLEAEISRLLEQHGEAMKQITSTDEPPTVENLLARFEESVLELNRLESILSTFASSVGGPEWDEAEARVQEKITAHNDSVYQDSSLYHRFLTLGGSELDQEDSWCVQQHLKNFEAAGAHLDDEAKERLSEINLRLSQLTTDFGQRVVKGQLRDSVALTEEEVRGLSDAQKSALAADAAANPDLAKGRPYLVMLRLYTQQPAQGWVENAEVRQRILEASLNRGDGHDSETDTRALVVEIARLRAEQAELLGYSTFADMIAAQATAGSTSAIEALITPMIEPTQRNVRAEYAALNELAVKELGLNKLTPSDWLFAQDKLTQAQFSLDAAELAPYFELQSVIEKGVFFAANRLYGLTFTRREDLFGYTPDVQVWEVNDADGSRIGMFLGDFYARAGKRGGAWMHDIQSRSRRGWSEVIVCNNLNITKPAKGEPTLLTWDEVVTAFHEFGHALHSLLTDVRWNSVAGTAVPRDFVEYPSQVNEIWASHPEVLANYAHHVETGEVIPENLVTALHDSAGVGEGFHMSEMLQAVLLDQSWHRRTVSDLPEESEEVDDFESKALERFGIASPWIAPRYRTTYFNHIFSGGYAAGYYSYLWSEALDADTVEWFRTEAQIDGDGGFNRAAGKKMRDAVLSRGNSRDPIASFEDLRGRPVDTHALLKRHRLLD